VKVWILLHDEIDAEHIEGVFDSEDKAYAGGSKLGLVHFGVEEWEVK
jgi:hypothetical protein